jgi:Protein of unknown function DUF104
MGMEARQCPMPFFRRVAGFRGSSVTDFWVQDKPAAYGARRLASTRLKTGDKKDGEADPMQQVLEAVYENGALRLLTPVALREQQRVTLTLAETASPSETSPPSTQAGEPSVVERPWRDPGLMPTFPQTGLFVQTVEVRTADLPPWQPLIDLHSRCLRDDDDDGPLV